MAGAYLIIGLVQKTTFIPNFFHIPDELMFIRLEDKYTGFDFWLRGLTGHYLHYTPIFVLIILNSIFFAVNFKKITFVPLLLYYLSTLFFFAFFISTWGIQGLRYFAPSLIPMISFTTFYFFKYNTEVKWIRIGLYFLCFVTVLLSIRAYSLKINLRKLNQSDFYIHEIKGQEIERSCLNSLNVTINKPKDLDYYMLVGAEKTAKEYSKRKNIPLCTE